MKDNTTMSNNQIYKRFYQYKMWLTNDKTYGRM